MCSKTYLEDCLVPERNSFGAVRLGAALVVAVTHAVEITTGNLDWDWVYAATGYSLGQHAVHVFFILSGLLVTASLVRTNDFVHFVTARALRIFPGLIACAFLTVVVLGPLMTVCPITGYVGDAGVPKYFLETILLVTGRAEIPGVFASNPLAGEINNSVWTLKYEVLCYLGLAAAFMAGLLASRRKAFALLGILLTTLLASYAFPELITTKSTLDVVRRFVFCFALGSAAYFASGHLRISTPLLGATGAMMLLLWSTGLKVPSILLFEAYAVIWIASFRSRLIFKFTSKHDLSYGTYLYGWPISQSLVQIFPGAGPVWIAVATLCLLLPVAAVSWHLIEHSAQRWGRGWNRVCMPPCHHGTRGSPWRQPSPRRRSIRTPCQAQH